MNYAGKRSEPDHQSTRGGRERAGSNGGIEGEIIGARGTEGPKLWALFDIGECRGGLSSKGGNTSQEGAS